MKKATESARKPEPLTPILGGPRVISAGPKAITLVSARGSVTKAALLVLVARREAWKWTARQHYPNASRAQPSEFASCGVICGDGCPNGIRELPLCDASSTAAGLLRWAGGGFSFKRPAAASEAVPAIPAAHTWRRSSPVAF
jgi:hypothetical protein